MRIIFVRHGNPDYINDCLTELGHKQAQAAAVRLKKENIDKFYSSSYGRAYETALHIAEGRNMEVEKLYFMREIDWAPKDAKSDKGYSPWDISEKMVENGQSIMSPLWANEDPFDKSLITDRAIEIGEELDKWLEGLGYKREGEFYRVSKPKYKTILLASHAGSSTAALSHIFNLPMPFVSKAIPPQHTAITIVSFSENEGRLVSPKFEIANDARHIKGITVDN